MSHSNKASARRKPVPLAVLLPPLPMPNRTCGPAPWCGIHPRDLAEILVRYTRPGDVVIDLDDHPSVRAAAEHHHRQPAAVPPALRLDDLASLGTALDRPHTDLPSAGLVFARLPRSGAYSGDLPAMTTAFSAWRRLLRPGGFLLAALTAPGPDFGRISHRTTVLTAARVAGLQWRQEFIIVTEPLPEHEPRAGTEPVPPPSQPPGWRHRVTHIRALTFRHLPGGDHA